MNEHTPDVFSDLRSRCKSLRLPVWRCDLDGRILAEPDEPGMPGLWLRARPVSERLAAAAATWKNTPQPQACELMPGLWALPVPECFRRERVGYLVAGAIGPELFEQPEFHEVCASGHLDERAARAALGPIAVHTRASARALGGSLEWMRQDLARAGEDRQTIEGFTRQLTDGFETIDLLYSLGRSMSDLTQPRQFVSLVCQRVQGAIPFAWIGAWFGSDAKVARVASSDVVLAGACAVGTEVLRAVVPELLTRCINGRAMVLDELPGCPLPASTQVLVQPITRGGRVIGCMLAGDKGGDDPQVSSYDIHLLEATGGYIGAFLDNAVLYDDQQRMFLGTIEALTSSIDAKDRYTCGHSDRVALLSKQLALAMGLPESTAERVHVCGLLHDVGKIGVPEGVLCKPGRLSDEEFELIKKHPEIGHRILRDIPLLADTLPGVLHHHERFDGKGYPQGLSGEHIPLFARILALADTFDAMSSNRAYRPAMPRDRVLEEFRRCAGTQFDPALVEKFVALDFSQYDRLVARAVQQQAVVTPDKRAA